MASRINQIWEGYQKYTCALGKGRETDKMSDIKTVCAEPEDLPAILVCPHATYADSMLPLCLVRVGGGIESIGCRR